MKERGALNEHYIDAIRTWILDIECWLLDIQPDTGHCRGRNIIGLRAQPALAYCNIKFTTNICSNTKNENDP